MRVWVAFERIEKIHVRKMGPEQLGLAANVLFIVNVKAVVVFKLGCDDVI